MRLNAEAYELELDEGMVVLDCLHRIQHEQEPDMAVPLELQSRGKCGSCSAENQRASSPDVHDPDE